MTERPEPVPLGTDPGATTGTYRAAAALCLVLFAVLQPETFGLTPNGVDPVFYTGLGINFDDAFRIGAHHYFVSRWSAYYPILLGDLVAGPHLGRLLVRWVLCTLLVGWLWRLRPGWGWGQRILTGTVLVTMPVLVRALFTDYVEYAVAAYTTLLILLAIGPVRRDRVAFQAGLLLALVLVANPFAIITAGPPLVLLLVRTGGLRRGATHLLMLSATTIAVVAASLYWFRWVHGHPNIYRPTLDFIANAPDGINPARSAGYSWLPLYLWIFLPFALALLAAAVALGTTRRPDNLDWMAVGLACVQFALQALDHFWRKGIGLEISYYWSMAAPSIVVAAALLTGRVASRLSSRACSALTVLWLALLLVPLDDGLRLPPGWGYAAVCVVVAALVWLTIEINPGVSTGLVLLLVAWTQVGAPADIESADVSYIVSPHYDQLFWGGGSADEAVYDEVVWLVDELDAFPDDDEALFLPADIDAYRAVGVYHAHVADQIVGLDPSGGIAAASRLKLQDGSHPYLVVFGPEELAAPLEDLLDEEFGLDEPVLREVNDSTLRYSLTVYELPEVATLPLTFTGEQFHLNQGGYDAGAAEVTAARAAPGTEIYGPYLPLAAGAYEATISYRSPAAPSELVGWFDVYSTADGQLGYVELPGTSGVEATATVPFVIADGTDRLWEFRTNVADGQTLRLVQVEITTP